MGFECRDDVVGHVTDQHICHPGLPMISNDITFSWTVSPSPMRSGGWAGLPVDNTSLERITAMAKVISTLFISADGVAEIDPGWHFPYFDENMGRAVGEDYDTADVLLIGRETYDSFAGAWPGREAAGGDDAPFARQLGDVRKVVVSRQRLEFSWRNSELIKGDLLDAVTALKADAGIRGILIPGSISVVQQLLAAGRASSGQASVLRCGVRAVVAHEVSGNRDATSRIPAATLTCTSGQA